MLNSHYKNIYGGLEMNFPGQIGCAGKINSEEYVVIIAFVEERYDWSPCLKLSPKWEDSVFFEKTRFLR
ncbi:hypothetical protein BMS3Bbin14_01043 [bacterium BMS3Bbin14]|nr:hypothetical protein BMS3Abin13_01903 [bacterium BMS3Abin13]GBE52569.1 hypothetical protein BMS3Bbin14_01043 [bacterium BMS3Bbin14]